MMWLAIATGVAALTLMCLAFMHNATQAVFQQVMPAAAYASLLLEKAPALRIEFFVDNLFLCLYGVFFALLPSALKESGAQSSTEAMATKLAAAALLLTTFLDAVENSHILSMLAQVTAGQTLSQEGINLQAIGSQVKFLSSYAGLFALSFGLNGGTKAEKSLAFVLRWVQAPLGVAAFVAQPPILLPIHLGRAVFFWAGMFWIAYVLYQRSQALKS